MRGRAAVRDFLAKSLPLAYPVTFEPNDVGMSGDLAYAAGLASYAMRDGAGNSLAHAGPYSFVLRNHDDGVWEIQLLTIPGPGRAGTKAVVPARRTEAPTEGAAPCRQAASECPQDGQ